MCDRLSQKLADIPGVVTPFVPPDRTHVYYFYIVRFDPVAAGLPGVPPREFREKVSAALDAEGVHLGQWQTLPVYKQEVIAARVGYGQGCPWNCPYGEAVEYRDEEFPNATRFFEDYTCLWNFVHYDRADIVDAISDAFHKVFENLQEIFTTETQRTQR